MAENKVQVVVHASSNVVASDLAQPTYTHKLSNLDLLYTNINQYMQASFAFNGVSGETMQSLKDSLSKTLSVFPVLTGRLKNNGKRLEIEVNNKGVPFIEATANYRFDELQHRHSQLLQVLEKSKYLSNMYEAPLIQIQATVLECGSILIGLSFLHLICDGSSAIHFMQVWSEIHRNLPISNPPVINTIKARDPPQVNISVPASIMQAISCNPFLHPMNLQQEIPPKNSLLFLKMTPDLIKKCIKEVEESSFFSYGKASAYEAISGLLWNCITRARKFNDEDEQLETGFRLAVSLLRRGRFNPPLPVSYFGNSVMLVRAKASVQMISNNHFAHAATIIHKTLKECTAEASRSAIDWMELHPEEAKVGWTQDHEVVNSDLSMLPFYDVVDFGWGKMKRAAFSGADARDGMTLIAPCPGDKYSKQIIVCIREDHALNLLLDPIFSSYFIPE